MADDLGPNVEMIRGLNLPGTPRATSACRGIPLLYFFPYIPSSFKNRRLSTYRYVFQSCLRNYCYPVCGLVLVIQRLQARNPLGV